MTTIKDIENLGINFEQQLFTATIKYQHITDPDIICEKICGDVRVKDTCVFSDKHLIAKAIQNPHDYQCRIISVANLPGTYPEATASHLRTLQEVWLMYLPLPIDAFQYFVANNYTQMLDALMGTAQCLSKYEESQTKQREWLWQWGCTLNYLALPFIDKDKSIAAFYEKYSKEFKLPNLRKHEN